MEDFLCQARENACLANITVPEQNRLVALGGYFATGSATPIGVVARSESRTRSFPLFNAHDFRWVRVCGLVRVHNRASSYGLTNYRETGKFF